MDRWDRFDKTLLHNKEDFYSSLNMEGITDADYRHAKKVFKEFKIANLGEYYNLYVQSDTILLVDVFVSFRNNVLKYMNLILLIFISTWINMASIFKKDRNKIRITD